MSALHGRRALYISNESYRRVTLPSVSPASNKAFHDSCLSNRFQSSDADIIRGVRNASQVLGHPGPHAFLELPLGYRNSTSPQQTPRSTAGV